MNDKLLIVLTSQRGKTRSFAFCKHRLKRTVGLSLVLLAVMSVASVAGLKFSYQNIALRTRNAELSRKLAAIEQDYSTFRTKVAREEAAKEEQLKTALSELGKRSRMIESILATVGVDIEVEESQHNTGGPYTSLAEQSYDNLTFKVDHYLEAIQAIPLGIPVTGKITSKFGRRIDPINGRPAFHEGVDIKNRPGLEIRATADGRVASSGYTGGYGNFVEIDHGSNFRTRFFHMRKRLVKSGNTVSRGQVIGLLGSSGRSTGPHLHYEVKYRGKPVDPIKFMRIAHYLSASEGAGN